MKDYNFKEELSTKYKRNLDSKLEAIVSAQMLLIKKACIKAVDNTQSSVDFQLKDEAANRVIGEMLEKRIAHELGLEAKYVYSSDRDYSDYYVRISGWA